MRAIVCDPVCAQPFGHNAVALTLFRRALEKYFDQVEAVCCRYLPVTLLISMVSRIFSVLLSQLYSSAQLRWSVRASRR